MSRPEPLNRDSVEAQIRATLHRLDRKYRDKSARLAATAPLWNEIDSLRLLEILDYLEHEFDIELVPDDVSADALNSIEALVTLVLTRLKR